MRNKLGQFIKGFIPWNKEKKGLHLSEESEFKKGELVGEIHPSWKGGVQMSKNDCVHLWSGANKRIRRPKAIWELHNGTLPDGYIIYHLDGNKHNDHISNLKAITRRELLTINNTKKNKAQC
jgi:hypothetical protein